MVSYIIRDRQTDILLLLYLNKILFNVTAIVMAMGYERGWFTYGDKISQHWPEFAQKGKVSCHNVLS